MNTPKSRAGRKPSVQFTPSKRALIMIDALLESGLFGTSRSAVVQELAYRELRRLLEQDMFLKIGKPLP